MNKSIKNIFWGVFGQVVTIIIGLILPRLRIVSFGSEVNGLLSSVQQIYVYLALLEAGIGATSLQSLYKPVAKGDRESINGIMAATDAYYKKTGVIYLIAIFIFAIAYPLSISSDIDKVTIIAVILLNGLGNVLAYFFQGKYKVLLQAEGKKYIITNLATFVTVFSGIAKIALMFVFPNVIVLQAVYFIFSILQVIYFAIYIRKHYKWINLKVTKNNSALTQKNSAFLHQFSQLIFNNTDVLLLTYFCGLKIVSVYALYNMVFDMVSTLIGNINEGFLFKIGQLFNSDREGFDRLYNVYERFYLAISFSLYCICFLLITPFISLYTEGVTDISYYMPLLPLMFVIVKLFVSGRAPSGFVASCAGHFKLTQNRAIIEAVINLVVSIICINFWGIYGVLAGTIVALLYRANDMIIYCNKRIIKRRCIETYKWWLLNIALFILIALIFNIISIEISSYVSFILVAFVVAVITILLFLIFTYLVSNKQIKLQLKNFIVLRKKLISKHLHNIISNKGRIK